MSDTAVCHRQARANQQLTETEWEALAQAVKEETGHYIQWRNWDELA
jgi:hypothetical protein